MTYLRQGTVEALLLVLAALGSFLVSFRLWGTPWAQAAFPLVAVGLVGLAAAALVLARTPRLRRGLALRLVQDPAAYRAEERARMARVLPRVRLRQAGETVLLAAGLLLLLVPPWRAVGAGCAAQGALTLAVDLHAGARARAYVRALERFLDPRAPVAGEMDRGE